MASVAVNGSRRLYPVSPHDADVDADAAHAFPWALDKYTHTTSSHYRRQLAAADAGLGVGRGVGVGVGGTFSEWDNVRYAAAVRAAVGVVPPTGATGATGGGRELAIASSPSVSNPIVCIAQVRSRPAWKCVPCAGGPSLPDTPTPLRETASCST